MARKRNLLSAKTVEHAKAGRHNDGGGLSLVVKASGARSWVVRVTVDGIRRDIGVGGWPQVSLAEARQRRDELAADAADGGDPATRPDRCPTFREAAAAVHAMLLPTWRNPDHAAEWLASLHRHAEALLDKPADRITRADVLDALEPIWLAKPETGRRVRQRIRKVMSYVMARHEHIVSNPAGEGIDGALVPQRKVKAPQRAVHYSEVPGVIESLIERRDDMAKLCLRFVILTAARSGEARNATWAEIDGDTWTVPAERMKMNREHRVPLSAQALGVLAEARRLNPDSDLIFPSPVTGEALSWQALLKTLRKLHFDATVHGFRSSFRTWALEQTTTPFAVAEAALAHVVGDSVQAAYIRSDLFEARVTLMQAWADFVDIA